MTRAVASSAATLVCTATLLAAGGGSATQTSRTRSVYATVTDSKHQAVAGLSAADFAVKEGGKDQSIVSVEPATTRLTISVLVADNGSGVFRLPLARFIQKLQPLAEFAINSVVASNLRVVDFTSQTQPLNEALGKLGPRDKVPGGQLLPAISEAALELKKREAVRSVIVVLTVGEIEHLSLPAEQVLDQIRKSRAALYVVAVPTGLRTPGSGQGTEAPSVANMVVSESQQRAALAESEVSEGGNALNRVLDEGVSQSGGRFQQALTGTAILANLQQVADELPNQYLITYTMPEGGKPTDRLVVSLKRKGLTVRAPTRLPN